MNELNFIWKLVNEIPEYSYNNGDTWVKLVDNKDLDAIVVILTQILHDDNISTEDANIIFKYINDNGLLIQVFMATDYLLGGKMYPIYTFENMLEDSFFITLLSSPKIIRILVKSTYALSEIFRNKIRISFNNFGPFIKEGLISQLQFFITELDLFNNPRLIQFLDLDTMNIIMERIKNDIDALTNFLIKVDESGLAIQFYSQEFWENLSTDDPLFALAVTNVRNFTRLFFSSPRGVEFLQKIYTENDTTWIEILTNVVAVDEIFFCSLQNPRIFDIFFDIEPWYNLFMSRQTLRDAIIHNDSTVLNSHVAMSIVGESEIAMTMLSLNSAAMRNIAASLVAVECTVINTEIGRNIIVKSATSMNEFANSATAMMLVSANKDASEAFAASDIAMIPIASSTTAMNAIMANSIGYNAMARSTVAMNRIGANLNAINNFLSVAGARTTLFSNSNGMNGITNQLVGMQRIMANATYYEAFFSSQYYVGKGINTYASLNNATLSGLQTITNVCENSTVMTIIAASSIAMLAIASAVASMNAVIISTIAMSAIMANATGYNTLAQSLNAMNRIGTNATATDTFMSVATARTTLWVNSNGMNGITGQLVGMQRIMSNTTNSNGFFGATSNVGRGLNTLGSINNSTLAVLATWANVCANATAIAAITGNTTCMTSIVLSSVAMSTLVASSTGMNAMAASNVAMNLITPAATAMNAIIASTTAMNSIMGNAIGYNAVAQSTHAMDRIGSNATAMNTFLGVAAARTTLFASSTGMNGVTGQLIGMQRIMSSTTYSNSFFGSSYYVGKGLNTLGSIGNSTLAGLMTWANVYGNSTAISLVAGSTIVMESVAASSTAMNAIVGSSTGMNAIANNSVAVYATIINSTTARNAIIGSSTAMTSMAAYSVAMDIIVTNSTVMSAIAASTLCMRAMANNSIAYTRIVSSSTARTALASSPLAYTTTYNGGGNYSNRTLFHSGRCFIINVRLGYASADYVIEGRLAAYNYTGTFLSRSTSTQSVYGFWSNPYLYRNTGTAKYNHTMTLISCV